MKNGFQMTGLAALALLALGVGVAFAQSYGSHNTGSHGKAKPKAGKSPTKSKKFREFKDLEDTQLALVAYLTDRAEINAENQDGAGFPGARGAATLFIVDPQTICYGFLVRGIKETPSAVHIHRAPAGKNGPVAIAFDNGVPKDGTQPAGNPGWSSGCKTVSGAEAEAVGRLLINPKGYYLNIHSTPSFPNGAIRGQLSRMLFDND